jgi:DNA-nicking Smr family endonuclease
LNAGKILNMEDQDDDAALFRAAVRGARPLKHSAGVAAPRPRRIARAQFARAERAAVLAESLAAPGPFIETQPLDELQFRRNGVSDAIYRRLRRGDYRIEAELDLHGLNARQATEQLTLFLYEARKCGLRCLRVIHGKGMRSGPRGPVLKQTANTILRRTDAVLAFSSARARDGGTGATLVLMAAR